MNIYTKQPISIDDQIAKQVDANKLYATLCYIAYWLDSMERGKEFREKLYFLFKKYPSVDTAAMGFPHDWENEPLWKGLMT